MKHNTLFFCIFAIVVIFFSGCIFDDDGRLVAKQCEYFPLTTGNTWVFESTGNNPVITETVIVLSSSKYGSLLNDISLIMPPREKFSDYILINNNGEVHVYDKSLMNTFKCYSFRDTTFGRWTTIIDDLAVITDGKGETIETPAGTFTQCYHFRSASLELTDSDKSVWFAPGIGPVRVYYHGHGPDFLLKSAKINRIIIGANH